MEAWIWLKGKKVIKNVEYLLDKWVVIKHHKMQTGHTYLRVLKTYKSNTYEMASLFSNEDFWVDIHPEDDVMILN